MKKQATIEHLEHAEHASHVAHSGDSFASKVSVTIAIVAVVSATVGTLETIETAGAISSKNNAVLMQSRASDQWAFFQAKSIKKNIYELAAVTASPEKAQDFLNQAKRYEDEGKDIAKEASALERQSREMLERSDHHEYRHHVLTFGATLLHVSIAIATVAIITKGKRWPWYLALVLAAAGIGVSAIAYL